MSNELGKSEATPSKRALIAGTSVVWPAGVELRYGISPPTRWRWEKRGRLPARDVNVGGKTGWKPETLAAAEARVSARRSDSAPATGQAAA